MTGDEHSAAIAELRSALVAALEPHLRLMCWIAIALGLVLNAYLIGAIVGAVS